MKVVYSREPQQLAEPAQLRAEKPEPQDEWVSAQQAQRASRPMERSPEQALAAWEQFSEPWGQLLEASPGEPLELQA